MFKKMTLLLSGLGLAIVTFALPAQARGNRLEETKASAPVSDSYSTYSSTSTQEMSGASGSLYDETASTNTAGMNSGPTGMPEGKATEAGGTSGTFGSPR